MFVIWLLFDAEDDQYLSDIIRNLSDKYNSEVFIPHITVYGLVDIDFEILDNVVLENTKEIKSFFVTKNKINFSDNFWKTLFIELKQNQNLYYVNEILDTHLKLFSNFEFLPHISLLYTKLTTEEKSILSTSINVKKNFLISKIAILKFSENIHDWKIIKKYNLG